MTGFAKMKEAVIDGGLCAFCGACVAACPSRILAMSFDTEEPELKGKCPPRCTLCHDACPGGDIPIPEMEKMVFGRTRGEGYERILGIAKEYVKAYAVDWNTRYKGASGGLTSALFIYALENNIIDAAIVAGNMPGQPWRAYPAIVTNAKDVLNASQSKISRVPILSLIPEALAKGYERLAIVGCPCVVDGIRKMQLLGRPKPVINSIKFVIGLLDGGNCWNRMVEHAVEELAGISLDNTERVEFRSGAYPGKLTVFTRDGRKVSIKDSLRRFHMQGFHPDRCRVCIEYGADVADISVGDYFAPDMIEGRPGVTTAVIRTEIGDKLLQDAQAANYIGIERPFFVKYLFGGGFEAKTHGGAYNLSQRKKFGLPVPNYHMGEDYVQPVPRETFLDHPHIR